RSDAMPRINTGHYDQAPIAAFPPLTGVVAEGALSSRGITVSDDDVLHMWAHDMQPGAQIRWTAPPVDHSVYVWSGAVAVDGKTLPQHGVVVIEHLSSATLTAAAAETRLIHVHRPESHPQRPARAGGHTHVVGPEGIEHAADGRLVWANSKCPTCA